LGSFHFSKFILNWSEAFRIFIFKEVGGKTSYFKLSKNANLFLFLIYVYWPFLVVRPAESFSSSNFFFLHKISYFNNFHCALCFLSLMSSYSVEKLYCFYVRYQFFHLLSSTLSMCSHFVSVSLQCHRMWSMDRFTAQNGYSELDSLSITAKWIALVYTVLKWLMTTCSRLVIVLVSVFILWCGLRSFIVVVVVSHFSSCSCSYYF
jgi:hypothetical protein